MFYSVLYLIVFGLGFYEIFQLAVNASSIPVLYLGLFVAGILSYLVLAYWIRRFSTGKSIDLMDNWIMFAGDLHRCCLLFQQWAGNHTGTSGAGNADVDLWVCQIAGRPHWWYGSSGYGILFCDLTDPVFLWQTAVSGCDLLFSSVFLLFVCDESGLPDLLQK